MDVQIAAFIAAMAWGITAFLREVTDGYRRLPPAWALVVASMASWHRYVVWVVARWRLRVEFSGGLSSWIRRPDRDFRCVPQAVSFLHGGA